MYQLLVVKIGGVEFNFLLLLRPINRASRIQGHGLTLSLYYPIAETSSSMLSQDHFQRLYFDICQTFTNIDIGLTNSTLGKPESNIATRRPVNSSSTMIEQLYAQYCSDEERQILEPE